MNIVIQIENPNETQCNLIQLLAIQDKIKALKQDQDETGRINDTLTLMNKIISRDATSAGTNNNGDK